jgi:RHS repeat-associated protein
MGFATTTVYDRRGLRDAERDAEGNLTDYTYDKDGRMVTLANRIPKSFTWTYDDNTRTVTTKTPRQQPGQAAASQSSVAVLNPRGLPASATEPSGQTTTFTSYDDEGRLLTRTDGVGTTFFTYWPNGLPKETIENGRTSYRGYDALNRLIEYRDGEGNTFGYAYYPDGRLHVLTYPVPAGQPAKTVTYAYDAFGRLGTVTDWAGRVTSYTYDYASRLTRLDRPNGTHREQEYDAAGQLRFVKEFKSDGSYLAYQELRYDDDGRIVWRFLHPAPAPVTLAPDTLLYDDDNRLSVWNSQGVTFDDDGNLTHGPLPSGTFGTYGYDARNRLTSAAGSGYRYTAEGARVQVTGTDAATYVVDPNAALSRTLVRVKGGVTTCYVYGLGLLYEETAGTTKTYHYDHRGNTLALTTDGLTVTDRWSYAPFGVITSRTGTSDTPFQLHGEMGVMTDSSGLVCMRARYYHPRIMRFLNADPIKFDGGLNWFSFCRNNPMSFTDPLGLKDMKDNGYWDGLEWSPDVVRIGPFYVKATRSASDRVSHLSSGRGFASDLGVIGSGFDTAAGLVKSGSEVMYNTHTQTWLGQNGKLNSIDWGGNQHSGSRAFAKSVGHNFEIGGRLLAGAGGIVAGYELIHGFHEHDYAKAGLAIGDLGAAGAAEWGGPIGWAGGGAWAVGRLFGNLYLSFATPLQLTRPAPLTSLPDIP